MAKLRILVIDDENLICRSFEQQLHGNGYEVFTAASAEEGRIIFEDKLPDVVFLDNKLPGLQGIALLKVLKQIKDDTFIVFMSAFGTVETAVQAMKSGAVDYISKPFNFDKIRLILKRIHKKLISENKIKILQREQIFESKFDNIVGKSQQLKEVLKLSKIIAHSDASTVLLLGESGTGKDLLARAIHNDSKRKNMPFVNINCSAVPETLLSTELFGHERGAFTDARVQKKGLFEMADGGTVFLDEIGDVSTAMQVQLLSVIENKMFRRIGGLIDIKVDTRIIAATNHNLEKLIKERRFRQDLYFRLNVFQLTLPPLRARPDDILLLVDYFIKYFNLRFHKHVKGIDTEARSLLLQYNWPGNIRELRNMVERGVIIAAGQYIGAAELSCEIREINNRPDIKYFDSWFTIPDEGFSLPEIEKLIIKSTLQKTGGNKTRSARLMGISRDKLRYKLKKYDL